MKRNECKLFCEKKMCYYIQEKCTFQNCNENILILNHVEPDVLPSTKLGYKERDISSRVKSNKITLKQTNQLKCNQNLTQNHSTAHVPPPS